MFSPISSVHRIFECYTFLLYFYWGYSCINGFSFKFVRIFFLLCEGHMGNYAKINQQYCITVLICKQTTYLFLKRSENTKKKNQKFLYIIKRTRFICRMVCLICLYVLCAIFDSTIILFYLKLKILHHDHELDLTQLKSLSGKK